MKNVFIVAGREFRQILGMRSFWLTLLILPLAFAIGPLAQRFLDKDEPDRVMIVDRTGGEVARAITTQIALERDREALTNLSRYVQRHHLERADPAAVWAQHDRWYGDSDVATFRGSGGLASAQAKLAWAAPKGTPAFDPPKPDYEIVPVPQALSGIADARLGDALKPFLKPSEKGAKPVDYVLLIPANFGASPLVRLWANRQPSPAFVASVQDVLTRDLRTRLLAAQGVPPSAAQAASAVAPALAISIPPPGGGVREALLVRSVLPLAAAYLLMMSLMLSGSWMLQGTVEERSNKLLETVLACVSPEELMYGKLLGTVGVGIFMIAVWIGCGLIAAYATQGVIADMIRPALDPLSSPGTIAAMIYFFVVGYVTISVFFLAIGAMSDSMRDAQGYLMPVIMLILLPITLLMQAVLAGGTGGVMMEVLTWVPVWTPFAVLARLGLGIPTWEVVATGLILAAFTALELILLGRLFRESLLAQGQRPSLTEVVARMRRARGDAA
jgi:ABC-type Na+ efflux pump permease subunit